MKPFNAAVGEIAVKPTDQSGAYQEQPNERPSRHEARDLYAEAYRRERIAGKSNVDTAITAWCEAFPGTQCPLSPGGIIT